MQRNHLEDLRYLSFEISIYPNKMLIEECKLKLQILRILTYKVQYKNLRTSKIRLKHQANIFEQKAKVQLPLVIKLSIIHNSHIPI